MGGRHEQMISFYDAPPTVPARSGRRRTAANRAKTGFDETRSPRSKLDIGL
jgi:hypothetical protein